MMSTPLHRVLIAPAAATFPSPSRSARRLSSATASWATTAVRSRIRAINALEESDAWRESMHNITTCVGVDKEALHALLRHEPTLTSRRVLEWRSIEKASRLFIPSLGKFDVRRVCEELAPAAPKEESKPHSLDTPAIPRDVPTQELIPTPSELQLKAYFPNVTGPEARRQIGRLLRLEPPPASPTPTQVESTFSGREYLIKFRGYFDDEARANRLDELADAVHIEGAAEMKPARLFNRITERRETQSWGPDVRYEWLADAPAETIARCPSVEGEVTLNVLATSHEIRHVGRTLSNCAANYCTRVQRKECVLVAMFRRPTTTVASNDDDDDDEPAPKKALALGLLEHGSGGWQQLNGHSNQPPTAEMRAAFDSVRPELERWFKAACPHPPPAGAGRRHVPPFDAADPAAVVTALEHEDWAVWEAALDAVGALGEHAAPHVGAIAARLEHDDTNVRLLLWRPWAHSASTPPRTSAPSLLGSRMTMPACGVLPEDPGLTRRARRSARRRHRCSARE